MLALTLGIGANTAIFSVVNTILVRPLWRRVMYWRGATQVDPLVTLKYE